MNKKKEVILKKRKWIQSESEVKIVTKPWGYGVVGKTKGVGELWLNYDKNESVGDKKKRYVFKRLYIKKGTRTSFQYHVKKEETNHLVSGRAEAWFENSKGKIEKSIAIAGDSWSIPAGKKHRIIALTNIVLIEASSPEVDDVVRLADDAGRTGGRIKSEHQARR